MKFFLRFVVAAIITVLMTGCQTRPQQFDSVQITAGNLRQSHLNLTYSNAAFNDGILTIAGGIKPRVAPLRIDPGILEIRILNTQGTLLKTVNTTYSPSLLHFSPKKKRTGHFSIEVGDVAEQALRIEIDYRKS